MTSRSQLSQRVGAQSVPLRQKIFSADFMLLVRSAAGIVRRGGQVVLSSKGPV